MDSAGTASMGERWEIGDELGSGAIARVVRVRDRMTGAIYAAKLLHPRHERDATAVERFRREAELSSRLVHDNLVRVWGTDRIGGHTALVMELVEGHTLATELARRGTFDELALLDAATALASGLAYAHGCGVIHRDLKPANVLVSSSGASGPKIADFGMARASSFAEADKGALTVLGTPPYMAPECLDPLAVDPRTDLYALGCMLHEMATGAPPYGGPTPFAVLEAHRTAPIPRLGDAYSEGMRRLVASLLAKAAGDRPQSAGAVLTAIASLRDPNHVALALRVPEPEIAAGRCAGCGADILTDVRVCFRCGLVPVALEPGRDAVLVVGPGRVSDKLDSERRDRLVQWLRANAKVGFATERLEKKIPRLPFVLVRGVSTLSAQTIAQSLARLGIEAEATPSPMSHPAMQRHVRRMTGRGFTVSAAIVMAPALAYGPLALALAPLAGIAALVSYGISRASAGRTTVTTSHDARPALPPGLGTRIAALPGIVPRIEQRRHREALGAVVRRVLSLVGGCDPASATATAPELEHAINLAGVATLRMDDIERSMTQRLFDPGHSEHRALMHERDMWAARLLDLTATLDALAARMLAAQARAGIERTDDALAELRAQVDALEEVSRL
jgi:hypothetical protein